MICAMSSIPHGRILARLGQGNESSKNKLDLHEFMKNIHVLDNITALDFDLMNSRDLNTNYINLPVCLAGLDSLYMPLAALLAAPYL